mmetsp:Transcript_21084/g.47819  ORF Transcript_21084/g.47819 Transcript_21084/m.47819 type:complete len:690 (-) Transcript_21084:1162-3231(-)
MPHSFKYKAKLHHMLDNLKEKQMEAEKLGLMTVDEFESVRRKMAQHQLERITRINALEEEEKEILFEHMSLRIQRLVRGHLGRKKAATALEKFRVYVCRKNATVILQRNARGYLDRLKAEKLLSNKIIEMERCVNLLKIQSAYRVFLSGKILQKKKESRSTIILQKYLRGMCGRLCAEKHRRHQEIVKIRLNACIKIQNTYRMFCVIDRCRLHRIHALAAGEIQRVFRGFKGRRKVNRIKEWEAATPGPERIKLGMKMIQASKDVFDRQQNELDTLHTAQENAHEKLNIICKELQKNEAELQLLDAELDDIRAAEEMTQYSSYEDISSIVSPMETEIQKKRIKRKSLRTTQDCSYNVQKMKAKKSPDIAKPKFQQNETYVLPEDKRKTVERVKRKQRLEQDFTSLHMKVVEKRSKLESLESSILDLEATRQMKERELQCLQRNLTELLTDQQAELYRIREKGIELEVATSLSAVSAAETAKKAKEHEKQTSMLFHKQEELMKFQFMSMGFSYFSNLKMLQQMRDMNSDSTKSAIIGSAGTASAAASAAAAASLPNLNPNYPNQQNSSVRKIEQRDVLIKKISHSLEAPSLQSTELNNNTGVPLMDDKINAQVSQSENESCPNKLNLSQTISDDCLSWGVSDVSVWLKSISLSRYIEVRIYSFFRREYINACTYFVYNKILRLYNDNLGI